MNSVILIDIDKIIKNVIYSDNKNVFNFLLNSPVSRIARIDSGREFHVDEPESANDRPRCT